MPLKNSRFPCRSRTRYPQLLKAALHTFVADERVLDCSRDSTGKTTAQIGLYAHLHKDKSKACWIECLVFQEGWFAMRCPLVTITDTYRDQQGRSNHGRAGEEYVVWMRARGVFDCPGAGGSGVRTV
jgi:hypothetical protein